jgi:Initiator Replication protein
MDRLLESLKRILRIVVTVPIPEPETGEPAYLATHLFDFFTLPVADTDATVRFGLPKKLQPILARSNRWGRIKAEVVCAMTTKYAIALYEVVQLRANMDRRVETFPIDRFRDLLGVPPGAYERGNDFARFVIHPAMLEVNGDHSRHRCVVEEAGRGIPGRHARAGSIENWPHGAAARQGGDRVTATSVSSAT